MTPVYIALGSNLPPHSLPHDAPNNGPAINLSIALNHLSTFCKIIKQSTVLITKAQYIEDQPDFANQVILVETDLPPRHLLKQLKHIEKIMGRQETVRNGPRTIDLDILYYGSLVLDEPDLIIPHPRISERAFVLMPLAEIAPDFVKHQYPSPGSTHPLEKNAQQFALVNADQ